MQSIAKNGEQITLERVERCLDWLALEIENEDYGPYGNAGLLAYYERLSAEAERLQASANSRSLIRERARRLMDQKAARSS